ncbi:MAG TPA: high-affinity nickel-transport family protein [Acidobacteriaceae bacterium]|jgi:high-affinity nickel-transport protein
MTFAPAALASPSVSFGLFTVLALGFFLGMRHATDADHVVAVSTIVSRERRVGSAALIGALWGAGHTITIFAVGVGIIVFTLVIPPRVGLSMEFSVGLMLVLLGWINLRSMKAAWQWRARDAKASESTLLHSHDGEVHVHSHAVVDESMSRADRMFGRWSVYQWLRPLVVGLVHGLAGSAAVALLVLTTLHNSRWAIAYLLIFGVGTIAGMMVITIAMASALHFAGSRSAWIHRRLSVATGILSVTFGLFIVYQMGFVHGLFTAHPTWTPQ